VAQFAAALALSGGVGPPAAFETLVHFLAVVVVFWSHISLYASVVDRLIPNIVSGI
jgi:hypothetical protein